MTDATIITIVTSVLAAIVPTIAAMAALQQSKKNAETAEKSDKKVEAVAEKIVEIHTATNGNLSKVTTALDVANQKIDGLQVLVATLTPKPTPKPPE